jgi:hypothetical protein
MKNSLNNILSFLVMTALMFLMMYLMLRFAFETYLRMTEIIEKIKEFQKIKMENIRSILGD